MAAQKAGIVQEIWDGKGWSLGSPVVDLKQIAIAADL